MSCMKTMFLKAIISIIIMKIISYESGSWLNVYLECKLIGQATSLFLLLSSHEHFHSSEWCSWFQPLWGGRAHCWWGGSFCSSVQSPQDQHLNSSLISSFLHLNSAEEQNKISQLHSYHGNIISGFYLIKWGEGGGSKFPSNLPAAASPKLIQS